MQLQTWPDPARHATDLRYCALPQTEGMSYRPAYFAHACTNKLRWLIVTPTMAIGKLVGIYIAPNNGEPMQSLEQVQALDYLGLEGDRYALGLGAYSKAKPQKIRHVTLVGREAIMTANQEAGTDYTEAETRRNLITEGVELNSFVGRLFSVGEVLMYGEEPCDPCGRPSKLAGKQGFKEAFEGRGGLRARIITSGLLQLYDPIVLGNDLSVAIA